MHSPPLALPLSPRIEHLIHLRVRRSGHLRENLGWFVTTTIGATACAESETLGVTCRPRLCENTVKMAYKVRNHNMFR